MNQHEPDLDIFLQPGELYFGEGDTRIRTLLGSCVALTLWHPRFRVGGMCHYLLPGMRMAKHAETPLNGRYADDVFLMLMEEISQLKTLPADYEVKMFGGGSQFSPIVEQTKLQVPDRNIEAGLTLLDRYGFKLTNAHVGGIGYRNVVLDLWSGHVWLQHVERQA